MPIGIAAGAALSQAGVAAETAAGVGMAIEGAGWLATGAAAYGATHGEFPSSSSLRGHDRKRPLSQTSDVHRSVSHKKLNGHKQEAGVHSSADYVNTIPDLPVDQQLSLVDNVKREHQGHKERGDDGDDRKRKSNLRANQIKQEGEEEPPPHFEEPEDPMLHSMEIGNGMNAKLNELGMSDNYCVVPFEAIIESLQRDGDGQKLNVAATDQQTHGFFHWSASMSLLRYERPFREFMSLYTMYRLRGFSLQFDPIKLDTQFIVGQSKITAANTIGEEVNAISHEMLFDSDNLNYQAKTGVIPMVGPVVTAFVPRGIESPYETSATWETDFGEVAAMDGAIVHTTSNDTLPSVMVEYVPELSHLSAGYRCPHPLDRFNSDDMGVQDQCFPSLGSFYLRTSDTMSNIPLYKCTGKVLIEFAGIAPIPYPISQDPSFHEEFDHANYAAPDGDGDRRRLITVDDVSLRHNLNRHSWTSADTFSAPENFAASSSEASAVMNSQISTNASTITTHNQRIDALEELSNTLKSHAGTASFASHVADSNHTLDARITSTSGNVTTLQGQVVNLLAITQDSEVGLQSQVADLLAIIQDMTPSAWQTVAAIGGSFSSGFSSYTTTGNSSWANEAMIRYTKYVPIVGSCVYHVHFKGMVKKGTSLMGEDQVMFNIPSFIRPSKDHFQVMNADSNTSDYHFHAAVVQVQAQYGNVTVRRRLSGSDPDGTPSIKHVWLDGFSYFTDNDSANYGV